MSFMRGLLGLTLALLGVLACAKADEGADRSATERLIGVWTGFVVEGTGDNPDRGVVKLTLTIKEGQMSATAKEGAESLGEGTYEVQLTSDPHRLDAIRKKHNGQGETHEGIYSIEGDILKWCVTNGRARKRPDEFVTKPGAGQYLLVLRRQAADK